MKNVVLLLSGLFFYAWGEPVYVLLMIFSSFVDYMAGLAIDRFDSQPKKRTAALIVSLIVNLGMLGVFKYSGFIAGIFGISIKELPLPIGISFYTFQSMSYTIDMYMRKIKVQKSFLNFATYVSLFPQIVAGPIVRYEDVQNEIDSRTVNICKLGEGVGIFARGLGKKVLLANNIGLLWTEIKAMDYSEISVVTAWLGILAFTFQIYYDFSGYSDMAVGLGKMLGFNFPENFNHPYISKSVSEFWRRWHITLGSWFKSYVYIPLGGNRNGKLKTLRNT
ncbi:MAG: MBOAT family O-acyltransferase, partial [Porcipelethomonas sp.]